jgi:hypothetical protein
MDIAFLEAVERGEIGIRRGRPLQGWRYFERWSAPYIAGLVTYPGTSRSHVTLIELTDKGQRRLAEARRDRDASLAEDAKRLSPEGVAARAEGIAQIPDPHPEKRSSDND